MVGHAEARGQDESVGDSADDAPPRAHAPSPAHVPSPRHRGVQLVVWSVPVVTILATGWAHRLVYEDGFIYLRIVKQLLAGNGLVFSADSRVEAHTGTLWVGLLALADVATPMRMEWIVVLCGLIGTAGGVALAMAGSHRLDRPTDPSTWSLPFGMAVFVAPLPVWVFATSGFETGLVFAWLGGCFFTLAGWARDETSTISWPSAVLLGLGWLIRPDLVVFSTAFLLILLIGQLDRQGWPQRAGLIATVVALPLAYQIFRMGYYGSISPNTAIAKEGLRPNVERGTRYFRDFVDPYLLWVPVLGLIGGGYIPLVSTLARLRRSRALMVTGAFVACAIVDGLYVVVVGGDYIHARLFLPALFALCAPVALIATTRRHLVGLIVVPWLFAASFVLRPDQYSNEIGIANGFAFGRIDNHVTVADYGWAQGGSNRVWYEGPGLYFSPTVWGGPRSFVKSDAALSPDVDLPLGAFAGVGVSGFALGPDFDIIDIVGLGDSLTAHLENEIRADVFAGHEKILPAPWLAARVTEPGTVVRAQDFYRLENGPIPATSGVEFQAQVEWARAALECGDLAALMDASNAPLTFGRFIENVLGSFRNARVRVPPDPQEAYHEFCGPGTPSSVRALLDDPP